MVLNIYWLLPHALQRCASCEKEMPLLEEMSSYPLGQLIRRNMLEEMTQEPAEKITCKKKRSFGHFKFPFNYKLFSHRQIIITCE